ncbi:hypothetical protein [Oribacterium sp. Sow4_G1_1]|uniref:hypothetical protein n=1 Tax=Oribacterium sp. Sow4_G1_1 TaxID=3438794 RepID=UPI003F94CC97
MRKHSVQKMMKKTAAYTVLLSCLTTNILVAPMTAYAGQATADVDETLYLNLDYYGNVSDANVVKGINFNGTSSYTDFGDYLKITNMTDEQKPEIKNGSITFEKNKNGKFFFQGELKPDKIKAPWTFDITYKLNGVVTDADKIAGASGLVEMDIDCTPNKSVSKYMQDNMMLFVAIPVDIQKCYSVDAPESQTMTLGQYTGIVFTALPGQEGHFQVRLGTDQFESVGAIFAMTPGTVGALNKIKDLKDIKDDFRDDTNAMLDDFDNVLDDVTDVSAQLKITNQILEQLQSGKNKIHGNAQVIFDGNDVAIQDLRDLNGTLTPLNDDLKTAQWMVYDVNQNLNTLDSDLMDSSAKLKSLSTKLKRLGSSMSGTSIDNLQIQDMSDEIHGVTSTLGQVNTDIKNLTDSKNREEFKASASELAVGAGLSHVKNHTTGVNANTSASAAVTDEIETRIKKIQKAAKIAQSGQESNEEYVAKVKEVCTEAIKNEFSSAQTEAGSNLNTNLGEAVYEALVASGELPEAALTAQKNTIYILATALQNMGITDTKTITKSVGTALATAASGGDVATALAPTLSASSRGEEAKEKAVKALIQTETQKAIVSSGLTDQEKYAYGNHLKDFTKLQEDASALNKTAIGSSASQLADDVNGLTGAIEDILNATDSLVDSDAAENLVDYINSVTSDLNEIMDNGGAVAFDAAKTLNTLRSVISDIDELIGIMNAYYDDVQKTLEDSENVLTQIQKTSGDAATALQNLNSTLRSAEPDFSAAADNSFKVGHMAIDNTNKIVDDTKDFKSTGRNLRDTINNKLDEEEADNNFLNMDPEATKVSLTSDQNQEPTSIAIICRSDEISVDDDTTKTLDAEVPDASTTLLGRIKAVFVKLWNTVRSLLGMDD